MWPKIKSAMSLAYSALGYICSVIWSRAKVAAVYARKLAIFFWKLLVGGVLCQYAFTSVLAIGWSFRLAQRAAIKRWWKVSDAPEKAATFKEQCAESGLLREYRNYPNWFVRADAVHETRAEFDLSDRLRDKFRALRTGGGGSLWQNAKLGVQGIFNVLVLTIVPLICWEFGWYSGWDNSFNKGYEQFSVGVTIVLIGVGLFLVAMLYLPMAQARQAVTGDWRSFYHFRTVWRLIQRRRLACFVLAGLFSLVSLPLTILRTIPLGVGNSPEYASLTNTELLAWANTYYFYVSIAGFVGFALLRMVAARIYAGALLEAFRMGELSVADLRGIEGPVLGELGLVTQVGREKRHIVIEIARKAARPPWRVAVTAGTLVVWFTFVGQNFVTEFLRFNVQRGFINQPLVQLPWFRYVPDQLVQAAKAEQDALPVDDSDYAANSDQ